MRKMIYLTMLAILVGCLVGEVRAEKLAIGAQFPVDKLSQEKKAAADNTIVVFMPSLTYDCEYASMLTQSFYYYFDRRMAFEGLKKSPLTRVFLVVRDAPDASKSTQNIIGGMNVVYDPKGELFSAFEVKQPPNKNVDSTVVLLDADQRIVFLDEAYRAQGEHLKPLENKLKELNGIYEKVKGSAAPKALKEGDQAPDFRVDDKQKLSDLRGKIVLISFYPAAFSGTFPRPSSVINATQTGNSLRTSATLDLTTNANLTTSCATQIKALDLKMTGFTLKPTTEVKRIVISGSTPSLLDEWQKVLGTQTIGYTNDPDYSISTSYLSYNPSGYNNRVSVIIDQEGKIAYIDMDFNFNDEAAFNKKIEELLKK